MERPKTRYAQSGDTEIAHQVIGDGRLDLIAVPGWISHLDLQWEMLGYAEWIRRLSSFCRLILFDKRGTGVSERDVGNSTLEERVDDLRAVLDASGSEKATVLGFSEGGSLAMLYAATYPERVRSLILFGSFPATQARSDFAEGGEISQSIARMSKTVSEHWGEGMSLAQFSPSLFRIPAARDFIGRFERAAMSRKTMGYYLQWLRDIDTRDVARKLRVPTLVMHRTGDALIPVSCGRWLAENIPGARMVEFDGDDHAPWSGDIDPVVDAMQEFVTGSRPDVETDRVLATVLFSDIVGSTEMASEMGDRRWGILLERHHAVVRRQLERFRGIEQDAAGDGFFATFDGPARAVRCAESIREEVEPLGVAVRLGVHTGECERADNKMAGIAVHTAARVMSLAQPNEILVSSTVKDLVAGSSLAFDSRGSHSLKGIPGEWQLYAVA